MMNSVEQSLLAFGVPDRQKLSPRKKQSIGVIEAYSIACPPADLGGGGTVNKTLSFAVVHFMVAFSVGYALTGSIAVGGAIALIEPALNTVAYFFHEKAWERIRVARRQPA
jgi:uncharacterized membrane protein